MSQSGMRCGNRQTGKKKQIQSIGPDLKVEVSDAVEQNGDNAGYATNINKNGIGFSSLEKHLV
ncbi:MAG: hypothetical protein MUO43_05825 [Desulfobacterales bacterium]|nr:hypothetical protein [Desulfobacterales bacterium]